MHRLGITPELAIHYGIHELLLSAPKKPRLKYGPRRLQGEDERQFLNRERNREHAKATRIRKKIFREVRKPNSTIVFFVISSLTHSWHTFNPNRWKKS